jgi:iron(II)-dependent oxidoreductase
MLQTLQLAEPGVFAPDRGRGAALVRESRPGPTGLEMVRVEGGRVALGAESGRFAYDNERPRHLIEVAPFLIDPTPVSNAAYMAWIEEGGYERREVWSEAGWAWRLRDGIKRPRYWTAEGRVRLFDRSPPIRPELPVMHVSWYEADAFARAHGKRLPAEAEWETAATVDPRTGGKHRYPWGDDAPTPERVTLNQLPLGPAPVGSLPAGASADGVLGLIGDAWEWTASEFRPYPGFRAHPYPEYSETHFGKGYRVLRGGSWASRPRVIDGTFRTWDLPERRQIFAGFRCAADLPS